MADSRIGIGFIGCGDVALRSYVPGMAAVADLATTVAVYDADPARAERLADDLAARGLPRPRVVPTLGALLTDPDVKGVFNLTRLPSITRSTSPPCRPVRISSRRSRWPAPWLTPDRPSSWRTSGD